MKIVYEMLSFKILFDFLILFSENIEFSYKNIIEFPFKNIFKLFYFLYTKIIFIIISIK